MVPSRALWQQVNVLLAADATTLKDPALPYLHFKMISVPFTPRPDLTLADLVLVPPGPPSIDLTALAGSGISAKLDPAKKEPMIWLFPHFSGFFIAGGALTLPVTGYGIALIGNGGTRLFATLPFDAPIVFSDAAELRSIANQVFNFPVTMFR